MNAELRTDWFEDARFGMFVHFGLYSIPAGVWRGRRMTRNDYAEWIRYQHNWPEPGGIPRRDYDTLLAQFNPTGFDAGNWIRAARDAGMRYFIVTAKHHDGFALWDSKASGYNAVRATPCRRDLLGELAAACRANGLKCGFYYSHWLDWEHPGGGQPPWPETKGDYPVAQPPQAAYEAYWTEKCLPQVEELLTNYAPDLLWFDSWGQGHKPFLTADRLGRLIGLVRRICPACLINSRIGTEDNVDFLSMNDNEFPNRRFDRPWESSGTLNRSWGCHQLDFNWKPTRQLIRHLVDNASRGGNYQLNVGPTGAGEFQPAALRRLREIGAWLAANGAAVYGTRPAPYPEPEWGRLTLRRAASGDGRLYAFVYDPAPGAALLLAGPGRLPRRGAVQETGEPVAVAPAGGAGFQFTLPEYLADENIAVVGFDFE